LRALALIALLAGCAAPVSHPVVTDEMRSCPPAVTQPVPPPKFRRSIDNIAAWGNRASALLALADARLAECDRARAAAVDLLEKQP
jgi:hypothetical protein